MAIEEGLAYWASVTTPNTRYEPVYQVNLIVDQDIAEKYRAEGCTIRDMEEGPALVIKRKVNGPNGMIRQAPKLFDVEKKPLDELIGNGSKVKIQFNPYDWEYAGKTGRSLDFQAMQVLELVEYEGRTPDGAELGFSEDGSEF
jgi:hypothetical protein|tara:strand:+ start:117 stop:545 length:429 start_codon:yes stop_codon:yes gene_type:complete